MSLSTGTRIGNYEIVARLGSGGMGEVYRAHDTRLDRVVAIKALPEGFARDAERLARFEREAKLLAALDHPNIAGIYGIEDSAGATYLILELVEGESLAQRLARCPLTVRETLDVCGQIASAIDAAHERGIVHRDLKPGNVVLSPSGATKVLDFGLAKGTLAGESSSAIASMPPTVGMAATGEGIILGTAPYMSPEQARGRLVDRRADVWAFGCVLYECLTGRQAFAGETPSDVIARVLEREPDWTALPPRVPPRLGDLVHRCLTKEIADRPRDIGDLRRELSAIANDLSSPVVRHRAEPSLAVLYFENPASDSENEYFCAGITEDILTDLSKIKGMRVASRNAVSKYRGAPADIPKVAAELGVGAVLEGSVRRAGDRVRITAQLINAADGFHLWAERYDRTLQDVFAVQEEIASSIAAALQVALSPAETANLGKGRPKDVRAYDLYLKGRELYGQYTEPTLRRALEIFRQAAEVDPNYALAYAGIADCYGQLIQWGAKDDPRELARLGLEAARRAIALDPRLPEAYKAEGLVLGFMGDERGSHGALRRAVEIDPRFTPALVNLGVHAFRHSDVAGAERLVRRVVELDPQDPFALIWVLFIGSFTGRDDEVLPVTERIRRLTSVEAYVTAGHAFRAMRCLRLNDLAGVERCLREGLADGSESANMRVIEAAIGARAGRADDARRILAEVSHAASLGATTVVTAAEAAVRVGDLDGAIGFLQRQVVASMAPTIVRLTPGLHPLLERPPFAPRRLDAALVWPLEAPAIDAARHALFREVKIESGRPQGSDVVPA